MKYSCSRVYTLALCFFLSLAGIGSIRADHLQMSGTVGYTLAGDATMQVQRIDNLSSSLTSGTLKLRLYAMIYAYDGGASYGYLLAERTLGSLPPLTHFDDLDLVATVIDPPAGEYKIVMVLSEYDGSAFVPVDWYTFSGVKTFGGPIPAPPVISSALTKNGAVGQSLTYKITASNSPLEFRVATNTLPTGLQYNRFTGVISGTPKVYGTFNVTISAGNNGGIDVKTLKMVIAAKPIITQPPLSQSADIGATVTFFTAATAYPNVKYQWRKNGVAISGATKASYSITNVQPSHGGSYQVIASNLAGTTLSSAATLTVCNYSFTPATASFPNSGGSSNLFVTVAGTCNWTVVNTNSWISITLGGSATGEGGFTYSVAPNTSDTPRFGNLRVGNKPFTVLQGGNPAVSNLAGKTITTVVEGQPGDSIVVSSLTNTYLLAGLFAPTNAGTYDYSRTSETSGIFTYGPDDNRIIAELTFNSPVAGTFYASNALGQTQIGSFRICDTKPDYNGDSLVDIGFQNSKGVMATWLMNGTNFIGSALVRNGTPIALGWRVVGSGDFNRDGKFDLVFQHDNGKLAVWYMDGTNFLGSSLLRGGVSPGVDWKVFCVADLNGDGNPDIFFQHTDRRTCVWQMSGVNFLTSIVLRNGTKAAAGWRAAAMADFNGDGHLDMLWQHDSGQVAVWRMINGNYVNSVTLRNGTGAGLGWKLVGVADFNRDGSNDLLWQHDTGKCSVWFFDNETYLGAFSVRNGVSSGATWRVVGPK